MKGTAWKPSESKTSDLRGRRGDDGESCVSAPLPAPAPPAAAATALAAAMNAVEGGVPAMVVVSSASGVCSGADQVLCTQGGGGGGDLTFLVLSRQAFMESRGVHHTSNCARGPMALEGSPGLDCSLPAADTGWGRRRSTPGGFFARRRLPAGKGRSRSTIKSTIGTHASHESRATRTLEYTRHRPSGKATAHRPHARTQQNRRIFILGPVGVLATDARGAGRANLRPANTRTHPQGQGPTAPWTTGCRSQLRGGGLETHVA